MYHKLRLEQRQLGQVYCFFLGIIVGMIFFPINVKNGIYHPKRLFHLYFEDNDFNKERIRDVDFVLIFTYKTRYYKLQNLSNNFDKNFIEDLNYLYHGIIHFGILKTFCTSFNITAYTANAEIFIKSLTKPAQD